MTTTIEAFTGPLAGYRRVVIKIGSALLVEGRTGTLKRGWMESVAADVARVLHQSARGLIAEQGCEVQAQSVGQAPEGLNAGIAMPALESRDGGPAHATQLGKPVQSEAAPLPGAGDVGADPRRPVDLDRMRHWPLPLLPGANVAAIPL